MLSTGIVGLPNVGKSTLFNALTRTRKAEAANYPFCTIDPNVGVVNVPDPRLDELARMSKSEKIVPAAIEMVDIAGLVKGASEGEGLGNQFLSHIREVDAVVQVVRCFEESDIHHVSGGIDPLRDIEVIDTELLLADLATLRRRAERLPKQVRTGDAVAKAELALVERLIPHLDQGRPARTLSVTDEESKLLKGLFLLTTKPTLFACNVGESDLAALQDPAADTPARQHVETVRQHAQDTHGAGVVVISAQIESELSELPHAEALEYLSALGVNESGVGALIREVYRLLGLRTYLTTGPKETRAWTIPAGATAPEAAGVIHTDFQRGFIAAETVPYETLIELGGMNKAKEAGKLRIEGKEYVVQDGDVIEFRFNV